MANEDNFKVEIRQQTNWKGVTYYYLYVNDGYVDLSPDLLEVEKMAALAIDIFKSGANRMTVLKTITHGTTKGE